MLIGFVIVHVKFGAKVPFWAWRSVDKKDEQRKFHDLDTQSKYRKQFIDCSPKLNTFPCCNKYYRVTFSLLICIN